MKKTLKGLVVVLLMLIMLLTLTGCGNKIVATRETEENGIKYEEKVEIKLKSDKVDNVKMTMKFDDKETAEDMKKQLDAAMALVAAFGGEDMGMEIKQSGKTLVMELDAKEFASMTGTELEAVSKDELKKSLEEEGYDVK